MCVFVMESLLWQLISLKNKGERPHFLFNSSRTNIFLLRLNKEILFFALFFDIFDLKVWEKHIFSPKVFRL
jgi:hypothetical protein